MTGLDDVSFEMDGLRWVDDLRVSGRVRWDRTTGEASATMRLAGAGGGSLEATWNDWETQAEAHVTGRVGGRAVDVSVPAP